MSMRNGLAVYRTATAFALLALATTAAAEGTYGFGRPLGEGELAGWNIDVTPDGQGLPAGSGSVGQGKKVYEASCAACHGASGAGKPADRLVGGQGTLNTATPIRTIGSFWPYATTVYDYIYRAMPFDRPQSLTPDEVYAVTAYLLHVNGLVGPDVVMDAVSLPKVTMPNLKNFFSPDPRPDVSNVPCRNDCR